MITTLKVLTEVGAERARQETKWGQQNHPILDPKEINPYGLIERYNAARSAAEAQQITDQLSERGEVTYMDIFIEEVKEAVECGPDTDALRKELIQCAAVAVAMVESLDRNGR
jgi:hypothetical protein